jgi:hypothetical protein
MATNVHSSRYGSLFTPLFLLLVSHRIVENGARTTCGCPCVDNNRLRYTDPTGPFKWVPVPAAPTRAGRSACGAEIRSPIWKHPQNGSKKARRNVGSFDAQREFEQQGGWFWGTLERNASAFNGPYRDNEKHLAETG